MADKKPVIIIKKKSGGGHGHHGGAWKVAYADFVTAMMAFFLVMWLMGSDEETKAAIAHYFNNPNTPYKEGRDPASNQVHPLGERVGSGDNVMNGLEGQLPEDLVQHVARPTGNDQTLQLNREISELVEEILDGQAYAMDVNIEYMKFSVPASLLFKEGGTEFVAGARERLDKLGQLFRGYPGYILIEGHTDDQPKMDRRFGSAYEFSLAQSVAVMKYFVDHRWTREDKLLPRGTGPRRSISSNTTEAGRKQNRRIEFTLSTVKKF